MLPFKSRSCLFTGEHLCLKEALMVVTDGWWNPESFHYNIETRNDESCWKFSLKALRIKCKASVRAMMHSRVIRESTCRLHVSTLDVIYGFNLATHQPCGPFLHMLEKRLELGKKWVNYSGVLGAMFLGLKTQKRNSKIVWDLPGLGLLSNKARRSVESLIIIFSKGHKAAGWNPKLTKGKTPGNCLDGQQSSLEDAYAPEV